MTSVPKYWSKAKKYLSKKDKILSKLIKSYQSPSETILTTRRDIFYSLCKSIIGQQISKSDLFSTNELWSESAKGFRN